MLVEVDDVKIKTTIYHIISKLPFQRNLNYILLSHQMSSDLQESHPKLITSIAFLLKKLPFHLSFTILKNKEQVIQVK